MKKSSAVPALALLLALASSAGAWLPQTSHLVSPGTVKKVGVYRSGDFTLMQSDLFFELQNRLVYELKQVPFFDVYDYDKIVSFGADWHRNDPAGFLLSFDALVLAEARSNGTVLFKVLYPKAGMKEEEVRPLRDRAGLESSLSAVESLVVKRLRFSGEILDLEPPDRCVLNFGSNFDIPVGRTFVSFISNLRPNAVLRVESVDGLTCRARIVWRYEPVREGETVLQLTPDLLRNMHSRFVTVDPAAGPSLGNVRRVAAIDSRNIVFAASDFDNTFVVSDADNTFFIDPDRDRSVMLDEHRPLSGVAWKPMTHILAYTVGNDLFVYDVDHDRKLMLVQSPSPRFVPVNLVFGCTNASEVAAFGWDPHGSRFFFFLRGRGLYLTSAFDRVDAFVVRAVYPDAKTLQAEFSGNDQELWIKTPNNFDSLASVFRCRIRDAAVIESWKSVLPKRRFLWSADRTGVYDLVVDDRGRTNLRLLGDGTSAVSTSLRFPESVCDDGCLMFVRDRFLTVRDLTNASDRRTGWDQIIQKGFFPASTAGFASGFVRDTNGDKTINWKDRRPLFLYDVFTGKSILTLADDCDEVLGFTATAEYVFFRKMGSVYYRRLVPPVSEIPDSNRP